MRLDQIDAGHALGDGVFDLDARIDLDEIELAGVGILQELDGSRRAVADRAADLERRLAQLASLRIGEKRRRSAFHHLLIAPLHGAIALVQMHQIAVRVAQDLHFHVARAADQLLEINLVLAESRLGLAPRGGHGFDEIVVVFDDAHAAAAAAPTRFEHDRKTDRAAPWRGLAASSPGSGGVAGITGTPALAARLRASILLPSRRMVSGSGPTKMMPAAAQASANSGLSDKKP